MHLWGWGYNSVVEYSPSLDQTWVQAYSDRTWKWECFSVSSGHNQCVQPQFRSAEDLMVCQLCPDLGWLEWACRRLSRRKLLPPRLGPSAFSAVCALLTSQGLELWPESFPPQVKLGLRSKVPFRHHKFSQVSSGSHSSFKPTIFEEGKSGSFLTLDSR